MTPTAPSATEERPRLSIQTRRRAPLLGAGLAGLLVLVGANEAVTETIRLTGFDHSVTFSERVPE